MNNGADIRPQDPGISGTVQVRFVGMKVLLDETVSGNKVGRVTDTERQKADRSEKRRRDTVLLSWEFLGKQPWIKTTLAGA